MNTSPNNYSSEAIQTALKNIAGQIAAGHASADRIILIGIANGGIPFCEKLKAALQSITSIEIIAGQLNITFHRDDIGTNPIPDEKMTTLIPYDIEGQIVILVDDVLFSGRTVRAAINEIFDQGRPAQIELAVLFDRGNRRLPIQPDYTGFASATSLDQTVQVQLSTETPENDCIRIIN